MQGTVKFIGKKLFGVNIEETGQWYNAGKDDQTTKDTVLSLNKGDKVEYETDGKTLTFIKKIMSTQSKLDSDPFQKASEYEPHELDGFMRESIALVLEEVFKAPEPDLRNSSNWASCANTLFMAKCKTKREAK